MNLWERGFVWGCRRSWRLYRHANLSVTLDGMRVPIHSSMGLDHLRYRVPAFLAVLRAGLEQRPGGWVVDIGANIGQFLLNLLQVDRAVPYLGFEPLLPAAAYVRRIIQEGNLPRHDVLALALGEAPGTATLQFGSESDVSASLSRDARPPGMYRHRQQVPVSTADAHLQPLEAIAFVKLDVEGFELQVLRGMRETLSRHRPPMLIEVMPYAYLLDGSFDRGYFGNLPLEEARRVGEARRLQAAAVEAFLRERDYRFYGCPTGGGIYPAATLDRGASRDRETDFLVLPAESADAFVRAMDANGSPRSERSAAPLP